MSTYTPGPWMAHVIPGFKHSTVTTTNPRDPSIDIKTANHAADARLIAAAPDLLVALDTISSLCHNLPRSATADRMHTIAQAAIAKATQP